MIEQNKCVGCGACAQKCPKGCIEMLQNPEGFLMPSLNSSKCIHCGLCDNVCPVNRLIEKNDQIICSFSAFANDNDLRMNSSSGGLFSVIAKRIIENNGVVFGAAYDDNFGVKHIGVSSLSELRELRGSKYVQSDIGNTYIQTEKYLNQNKMVLFSGTACQIAGLKRFLQKDYSNLFTIDVLCHGVPSPLIWKRYREELEERYQSKILNFNFRDKSTGWKNYSVYVEFENGKKYFNCFKNDPYMNLFLKDICLRDSCHQCNFKSLDRYSDITLGDCWGIERIISENDDDLGTSVVIIHSEKGKKILEDVSAFLSLSSAEIDLLLPKTSDSRKSVERHPNRSKVFRMATANKTVTEMTKAIKLTYTDRIILKVKRTLFRAER